MKKEIKYLCPRCMGDMLRHEAGDISLIKKEAYRCESCGLVKRF